MTIAWWTQAAIAARADLEEFFADNPAETPSFRRAAGLAFNLFFLVAPLPMVARVEDEPTERYEAIVDNLTRVRDLSYAMQRGEAVADAELEAARFALSCFEPLTDESADVLITARLALTAMLVASQATEMFPEMWHEAAIDAYPLVWTAFNTLTALEIDPDDATPETFGVRPKEDLVGRAVAHQISGLVRQAGGGETMSSN